MRGRRPVPPQQLQTWFVEAEADYKDGGDDFDSYDDTPSDYDAAAAAEDRWIAQRDHAHYARAEL